MSFNKLFSVAIIVLLLSSCSGKNEKIVSESALDDSKIEQVELLLEFKSSYNDVFKVYYSDDPTLEITGENVISKNIFTRGNDFQIIKFKFPVGEKPYKLRLDVGLNQKSDVITIKNITLNYKKKTIDGDDALFLNFWGTNQSLVWDNENYLFNIVPFEGKKTPMLLSKPELNNQLLELYK